MKKYTKPSLEAAVFEHEDILTASSEPGFVKNVTGNNATPAEAQWNPEWDYND